MAQQTAPILDLGTLAPRPIILIDKKRYELRTSNEFTWLVYSKLQGKYQRLGNLLKASRKSAKQWTEQTRLQAEFVREILIAPDAIHARLGDFERLEIIRAFFQQVRTKGRAAPAPNGTSRATKQTST
jgi:hypothetical protein